MTETRELNRTRPDGDRNHYAIPVAGWPPTDARPDPNESIFDSNKAEVMSDDDVLQKPETVTDGPDVLKQVETERSATKSKRGKRVAIAVLLLLIVGVTGGLCFWFLSGPGATKRAIVPVNKAKSQSESDEAVTQKAIDGLNSNSSGVNLGDGTVVHAPSSPGATPPNLASTQPVTEPISQTTGSLTQTAASDKTADKVGGNNSTTGDGASSSLASVAKASTGRNEERSVRIGGAEGNSRSEREPGTRKPDERPVEVRNSRGAPSFGSMLPVRSLGVIYSLRSGALARFELTRDVKGKSWFLPHGTILVGALRGAEYNRAYIAFLGYIDSESGKFVQVGGDVLGTDGGVGVKGKRRQMTSTWSKVFRRLGEAGLNIGERAAASIGQGQGPIIITDAYGGAAQQLGTEFNGVLTNKDRDSFVEIPAGTACYVMITDLPEKVQGADALSRLSIGDLERKSNADGRREATGLSENELAQLLENGDASQIRAALPRMTEEMRKVAEAVLREGGNR
jgi:hypothetical protein